MCKMHYPKTNWNLELQTSTGVIAYQIMQPHIKTILDALDAWDKPTKHHYRFGMVA